MMRRMGMVILRADKLTTMGNIATSARHAFREMPTDNADPARLKHNVLAGAESTIEVMAGVKARLATLPKKPRKDAVLTLEYFVGASPEDFDQDWQKTKDYKRKYFEDALRFLGKMHGEENVIAAQIHLDEKTPHMSVYVVPMTPDGRLCARDFTGGAAKLTKLQTDFWKQVGQKHGLERGLEGSKAKHTTRKQYYAALQANPKLKPPEPPKKTLIPNLGELNEYRADLVEFSQVVAQTTAIALLDKRDKDTLAKQAADLAIEVRRLREQVAEIEALKFENRRLNTSHIEVLSMLEDRTGEVVELKRRTLMIEHQLKEKTAEVEALKRPTRAASKTSTNDFRP